MDDASLRLYGLNNCRRAMVFKLRSSCYNVFLVVVIITYAILMTTCFICNDIYYDERAVEYVANVQDSTSDSAIV